MSQNRKSRNMVALLGGVFALACSLPAEAADRTDAFGGQLFLNTAYESLSLPGDRRMGMLGLGLRQEFGQHVSAGVQTWSAVSGEHGGFITLGFDGGYRTPVAEGIEFEGGLFVGAGGGHGQNDLSGGGLMLRSYAQLTMETGGWGRIGLGASRVDFPNGSIRSTQPFATYTLPLADSGRRGNASVERPDDRRVSIVASDVRVKHSATSTSGTSQRDFQLVGIAFDDRLGGDGYLRLEAAGGAGGGSAGYMQVLAGPGLLVPLADGLRFDTSIGVGGAGGGGVDTGGGLVWKASAGLQLSLTSTLFTEASVGYLSSTQGSFKAWTPSISLGSRFGGDRADGGGEPLPLRVRIASQRYVNGSSGWRTQDAGRAVDNLGLQFDYFISPSAYLTGQALGAYAGKAGAYMTGLVGAGLRQEIAPRFFINGEGLLGIAGGGGIAVGSGSVWQGNAGLGYRIGREISLMATGGRIGAFEGNFRANVLGLCLAYGNR